MTAPDAVPEDRDGPPAVADFTGLDADDGVAAAVATFDDLDEAGGATYVRPDLLGRDAADPAAGGSHSEGPATVRTVSLDDLSSGDGDGAPGRDDGVRKVRVASLDGRRPRVAAASTGAAGTGAAETGAGDAAGDGSAAAGEAGSRGRGGRRKQRSGGSSRGGGGLSFSPQDDEARAKEICLRLLTDRARTVQELSQALHRKEIPDEVARKVLERFDEVGLVDDEAFAAQWVRSRHRARGLGRRAIAAELHRKGVAKEIAEEALTEIDAESEETRARELVDRKLRTVPVATKEQRVSAARRLVGMLARKGYGGDIAYRVVREAIAERGAEADELGEGPPD